MSKSRGSQNVPYIDNSRHIITSENADAGCFEVFATYLSVIVVILTFPFSLIVCIRVVAEFQRAVIFRLGRLRKGGARGPGVFFILPCIDDYINVDLRTVTFEVPPQEILTKDAVTIKVDAVVFYRLQDPLRAVIQIANFRHSTQQLAQTTLRNVIGTRIMTDLLSERDKLSHSMQVILDEATHPWGIKVERVEIKDVRLPISMQRAMAAEAEANREAKAKIVAAEGELNASRSLKEASDVISSSPATLQLRYLQTLTTIASEQNSTVIFPFPIDLFRGFLGGSGSGCSCQPKK